MLQKLHGAVGRWIAGGILGLIAVTFIFFGIDFTTQTTTYAAKVNGEKISMQDFQRALQAQETQYAQVYRIELNDDMRRQLRRSVIEGLVSSEALQQHVESEGYYVSDQRLADFVRSVSAFQVGGEFSPDAYRSVLANQGLTPTGFEALERDDLSVQDLQQGVAQSSFLTPAEFRDYIELTNERRQIAYALFSADDFLDQADVADDAVKAYYDANAAQYMTQESVDLQYIELSKADIAGTIEVTDEQLRDYYEQEKDRFATTEERHASHILIAVNDDQDRDAAEAKAQMILKQLKDGADFAKLAEQYSDDAGTASQGGDLGWVSHGMLEGPFEDALFSIQNVGDLAGPVETQFGFHIIRLDDVRAGKVQPYEAVRDDLRAEYQNRQAEDQFYDKANELADQAFDAYDELASVAADLDLPLHTLEGFTRSSASDTFSNSAPVVQAAFDPELIESGQNSQLINLSDNDVLVLRVTAHHDPAQQPFDAVESQIREQLERSAAEDLADQAAMAFEQAVDSGDSEPAAAAEAQHGQWHEAAWHQRSDDDVPTELLSTAFTLRAPDGDAPVREDVPLASGDHAVLFLQAVEAGKPEAIPSDQRDQMLSQLADERARRELTDYTSDVRDEARVRIPDQVLNPQL
jgi:peptidyl-prolyl cis-trans isomerase D